jgi:Protein of unknown function with HXXEE motif
MVKHQHILWVVVMATALHILEEYGMNFRSWADAALGIKILWEEFHIVNGVVLLFLIGAAMIGWRLPAVSLMSPALIGFNGLFFHLGLTIVTGLYSPGTVTGVILFIPVCVWAYYGAYRDRVLTKKVLIVSLVGGILLQFYPLLVLFTRNYFKL